MSEVREEPTMAGGNGLYLSMTRVVRLWFMSWGLHAQKIVVARSIVTPLHYPEQEPTFVALDWLVA